ncbi:hypothetical protein B0H21DRAFT_467186 [Amylocystis lapponica]|nr:hypothetical protein B0H21DRAFT_467186 [Amylocystis lapponica]
MNGDIEELVLSGRLFAPASRTNSPVRSRSASPAAANWPDAGADYDYDSDAERRRAIEKHVSSEGQQESIGMGPGRTGVKGVIRDRAEAASLARSKRAQDVTALNKAMEKASLGGKTWREEEKERLAQHARLEGKLSSLMEEKGVRRGRFGYLREVGVRSFVQAVEEERNVWVLVHIFDPSLDRCATLDDTLSQLARAYPSTKFLRARAGSLGFASTASTSQSGTRTKHQAPFPLTHRPSRQILVPGRYPARNQDNDDDDPFHEKNESDSEEDDEVEDGWEDDAVDTDVLPTLLVYRGGELEHAWVRVDWEAKNGIEELLKRHSIVSDADLRQAVRGQYEFSDDEDLDDGELVFGGSDDEL